jgi:signal peptidase I
MAEPGEHIDLGSDGEREIAPWLRQDDPVESFGNKVDIALRQLSVELAGLRAERDGLRLEVEGLRAQYDILKQQLDDRDRFYSTVRELGDLAQRLAPRWSSEPAPAPAPPAASPAPAPDPLLEAPVAVAAFALPGAEPTTDGTPLAGPPIAVEPHAPAVAADPVPPDVTESPEDSYRHPPALAAAVPFPRSIFDQPGVWLGEPPRRRHRRSRWKVWGSRLGMAIAVTAIAMVLLVSVGPKVLPYQTFFVRSGSMSPTFDTGSLIFLKKVDAAALERGDVITFERPDRPGTLITHRIVAVESGASGMVFETKGDANAQPDSWRVPASGDGWKYAFHVPTIGYLFSYLGTSQARMALLAIPAALLAMLSLIDIRRRAPARHARH